MQIAGMKSHPARFMNKLLRISRIVNIKFGGLNKKIQDIGIACGLRAKYSFLIHAGECPLFGTLYLLSLLCQDNTANYC